MNLAESFNETGETLHSGTREQKGQNMNTEYIESLWEKRRNHKVLSGCVQSFHFQKQFEGNILGTP